jgi:hypothetical protein
MDDRIRKSPELVNMNHPHGNGVDLFGKPTPFGSKEGMPP